MNDEILSLLGICRRAGRLVIGTDPAADSAARKKASLILYANDFSRRSLKSVLSASREAGVPVMEINRSKNELGHAVGKLCGVLAVEDRGFADKLIKLIKSEQGGEYDDKI